MGLKAKMYAHNVNCLEKREYIQIKKAKGIKKNFVNSSLLFNDYKSCLFENQIFYAQQYLFKCENQKMFTISQNKKSLTSDDEKRAIMDDDIHTLAWSHSNLCIKANNSL